MEVFLNVLWLLIALTGFAVWRFVWARQPRLAPRAPLQEWTAFVYAVVLLFFPISLSDDLHADLLLFDICSSGRRQSVVCMHASASHQAESPVPSPGVAVLGRFASFEPRGNVALLVLSKPSLCSIFAGRHPSGRAPPAVSSIA